MKTHLWKDIRAGKLSPQRLAEIDAAVAEESRSLHQLCQELGITQAQLETLANMTHSDAAKLEARDDGWIDRMRQMLEALGGTLEVAAVLGDKRVRVA
jgi:hypothetical protein